MGVKVSFIVTVYNAKAYIAECIESMIGQTYREIEVLLMIDCPTDGTDLICDEYARVDERVKCYHSETNIGGVLGRERGFALAQGEYVIFVDHDDYFCNPQGLECLLKEMFDADVLLYKYKIYLDQSQKYKPRPNYPSTAVESSDFIAQVESFVRLGYFPISPWSKICRREFLQTNHIVFHDLYPGDLSWAVDLFMAARKIKVSNLEFYVHRLQVANSDSTSLSENKFNQFYQLIDKKVGQIKSAAIDERLRESLLAFMAYQYVLLWSKLPNLKPDKQTYYTKKIQSHKYLLKYDMNPKVKKVALLYRLVGFRLTALALRMYIRKVLVK